MPIVILSVKSIPNWAFSHISEKVRKLQPPLTNFNTSTTIVFEPSIGWNQTSILHHVPTSIR